MILKLNDFNKWFCASPSPALVTTAVGCSYNCNLSCINRGKQVQKSTCQMFVWISFVIWIYLFQLPFLFFKLPSSSQAMVLVRGHSITSQPLQTMSSKPPSPTCQTATRQGEAHQISTINTFRCFQTFKLRQLLHTCLGWANGWSARLENTTIVLSHPVVMRPILSQTKLIFQHVSESKAKTSIWSVLSSENETNVTMLGISSTKATFFHKMMRLRSRQSPQRELVVICSW